MRQVEIQCECGNFLSATVFKNDPLDLTCSKCGVNFIEGCERVLSIKDRIAIEWPGWTVKEIPQ